MPSTIVCPSCASRLSVPDELLGRTVACPKCNKVMSVSGGSARPSPSVSSVPPPLPPMAPPPEPPPRKRPRFGDDDEWEDDDVDRYPRRYRRDRHPSDLKPGSGFGVTALVLGIVGVVLGVCCGLLGIPVPALAIIFGCLGLNREGRGMALAGLILGIVGLALSVLMVVVGFAFMGAQGKFR